MPDSISRTLSNLLTSKTYSLGKDSLLHIAEDQRLHRLYFAVNPLTSFFPHHHSQVLD